MTCHADLYVISQSTRITSSLVGGEGNLVIVVLLASPIVTCRKGDTAPTMAKVHAPSAAAGYPTR